MIYKTNYEQEILDQAGLGKSLRIAIPVSIAIWTVILVLIF
jgi:hypothetical protein